MRETVVPSSRWCDVVLLCLVFTLAREPAASANELFNDGDTELRWDNTLGYSTAFRVNDPNALLLADPNADDGDRNFAPGIISNRIDLLSQIDLTRSGFGIDVSVAAWYDTIYHQKNANDSPATFNPVSVRNTTFTEAVRSLEGGRVELVNAFFHGDTEFFGMPFSFRIGRYAQLWGESLFFSENGIAAAQAPIDEDKLFGRPATYAKDVFMPVAQTSAVIQLPGGVTVEGYYQFEWRKTRLPGAGSYFSIEDYLDAGGERYLIGASTYWYRDRDLTPPATGQFGAALRWSDGQIDYGLYALRFNAKEPQIYYRPSEATPGEPTTNYALSLLRYTPGNAGTYRLVYPQGIELYGASASFYLGDSSVAAEISTRRNAPLASTLLLEEPGYIADANKRPLYAVGDTLNAQVSTVTTFARNAMWDSADLDAEVAFDQRLDVTKNAAALQRSSDGFAASFRGSLAPTYFQVLPDLDLTLSFGLGYNFAGNSGDDLYQNRGGGDLDVSVTAAYRVVWSGSIAFTHFIGDPDHQPLADRDFIRFSIQRTF